MPSMIIIRMREKIRLTQAERQTLLTAITSAKMKVASVEDHWNQLFSGRSEELKNYWNNSLNGLMRSYRGNFAKQFADAKKEDVSKRVLWPEPDIQNEVRRGPAQTSAKHNARRSAARV